jgi:hypothetical protein
MNYVPFVESFVVYVIWEDFNIVTSPYVYKSICNLYNALTLLCHNAHVIYYISYFYVHVYYKIMMNKIHIP